MATGAATATTRAPLDLRRVSGATSSGSPAPSPGAGCGPAKRLSFVPGVSVDPDGGEGYLGETELIVLASRRGGYLPGTPRDGWDHAEPWLPHALSLTALEPRFITAELTLADVVPRMAELKPLAAESLAATEAEVDRLWAELAVA